MDFLWKSYGAACQQQASSPPAARLAPAHPRSAKRKRGGKKQFLTNSKTDKCWNARSANQDLGRKC